MGSFFCITIYYYYFIVVVQVEAVSIGVSSRRRHLIAVFSSYWFLHTSGQTRQQEGTGCVYHGKYQWE